MENPLVCNKNIITYFDETLNKNIELDQKNIYKYFKHVFILVKKNNKNIPVEFYNRVISKELFTQINSDLLIHKVSINILKNKTHFNNIIMLSDEQLKIYNIFDYELNNKNIVIPILNIAYQNLLKYLEQYDSTNTLQALYNTKVINEYYEVDDIKSYASDFICQLINNLEETEYWTKNGNCLIKLTEKFRKRRLTFQCDRMVDKQLSKIIKNIFNKTNIKNENYLAELDMKTDKNTNFNELDFYKISTKSEFSKEDINQLFTTLNSKQKFLLLANLMISKKYCQLVVNNSFILQLMSCELIEYYSLFRYLLSYAWIKFYLEECIKKTSIKTKDDIIFDINTASMLPVYPFHHDKPKNNPYMPLLIADSELKVYVGGVCNQIKNTPKICNLSEFKTRMNIFCTNDPNLDLFENIDFVKYKIAVTGSIITACIQKAHPLMTLFDTKDTNETLKFINYFNEYYARADIDIMFIAKDTYEFIDNVNKFYEQLVVNITKINSEKPLVGFELYNCLQFQEHIKLKLNKIGYLFVSEDFINNNIYFEDLTITNKIKYITDNIEEPEIKNKFRSYYEKLCISKYNEMVDGLSDKQIEDLKTNYPDMFQLDNIDFRIYINKIIDRKFINETANIIKNNYSRDIDLVFTYKYKIESPYLNHSLELFPIKYNDFMSVVSRFHLPCVRGYYDGSNVYLTPSCISAHQTYMNMDIKYISGSKDPYDIINKNRMRGFGTWLNSTERKQYLKYCKEVPYWSNLYSINPSTNDRIASSSLFGALYTNHKLYKPRLYNIDYFIDTTYVDINDRYADVDIYRDAYRKAAHSIHYDKELEQHNLVSINTDGSIMPVKKWIINYIYYKKNN
jgi:hypothetical protein